MFQNGDAIFPSQLTVEGFKSIGLETTIKFAPLTILAGANSSGKSSMMQALLLIKQTHEANFQPEGLLLNGPNVRFSDARQILSHNTDSQDFSVTWKNADGMALTMTFSRTRAGGLKHTRARYKDSEYDIILTTGMSERELQAVDSRLRKETGKNLYKIELEGTRYLLFPTIEIRPPKHEGFDRQERHNLFRERMLARKTASRIFEWYFNIGIQIERSIESTIHVPAIRGNPLRTYQTTGVIGRYPGAFEVYVASIIRGWLVRRNKSKINSLNQDLQYLGLAKSMRAKKHDATRTILELQPTRADTKRYYNISDVGFGVSQVLPVLVALHAAESGNTVFIEQPEIQLHPRAQVRLARPIVETARRGVRVIVETHSSLLLLGIQTLVARGELDHESVRLHWFKLNEEGNTVVDSTTLDKAGSFGNWDQDFGTVEMEAQKAFLDAYEESMLKNGM